MASISRGTSRLILLAVVAVLLFGFSPISRLLLRAANGSFSPAPYTSLALTTPSTALTGIPVGVPISIRLANRTGAEKTYHWNATEGGALVSLGEETLPKGGSTTILVPSRGANTGTLRIAITGTQIFLTVPVVKR